MIKKFWKIPLAYLLYFLGDMASNFSHATDWDTLDYLQYDFYNWCMNQSADLDEWDILWKSAIDDASIDGLIIANNIIECTTANNAAIALDCDGAGSEPLKNITIKGNIIKGTARR